ncbi:hypothetical protein EJ04DRAFT_562701 [Polyplosphaeria fusca]|uniref:SUN domain-containing protein n=1 Tax=Polyplosphaeria fusca TaxID=682080 RepID=A0A9P4R3H0_9PLEO|nr:hypothetical protein EJ04DRAFT_562701 [Polyplosphaeria fusca]
MAGSRARSQTGGATPRRSARLASDAGTSDRPAETGEGQAGPNKATIGKVKSRKSNAYGSSGRIGDAEDMTATPAGFMQAFQSSREEAVIRGNERPSQFRPSLSPVRSNEEEEEEEDYQEESVRGNMATGSQANNDSSHNISKSFGDDHEGGILGAPVAGTSNMNKASNARKSGLASSVQKTGISNLKRGTMSRLNKQDTPLNARTRGEDDSDDELGAFFTHTPAPGTTYLRRNPVPRPHVPAIFTQAPTSKYDKATGRLLYNDAIPPYDRYRIPPQDAQEPSRDPPAPAEAPAAPKKSRYSWLALLGILAVFLITTMVAGMMARSGSGLSMPGTWQPSPSPSPSPSPLPHSLDDECEGDRVWRVVFRRLFWLDRNQTAIQTNVKEIETKVKDIESSVQTKVNDMESSVQSLYDALPKNLAVVQNPDGSVTIPDEFWRALLSKLNSEGFASRKNTRDAEWIAFLGKNGDKIDDLVARWREGQDSGPNSLVSRDEFMELMATEYVKIRGDVDNQIAAALKAAKKELAAAARADATAAFLDQLRLESLALSNLVANQQLTLSTVNWFAVGNGAIINPYRTSPTYHGQGSRLWRWARYMMALQRAPNPPVTALEHWNDAGDCWCTAMAPSPGGDGGAQLAVDLQRPVYPKRVTVEHLPKAASIEIRSAPREMELWVRVSGASQDSTPHASTCGAGPRGWTCLGRFSYNVHASNHVQTFNLDVDLESMGVGPATNYMVRVDSNWGLPHTCLYRLRLHGDAA